jgi:hypothetical protein
VPPASEQAPAAVPAEEGASSQNVEAQVVIDGAVATATAGETAAKKPTEHTKAFKPSVPMLAGVVAADAVVLGKWFQRRAEAKRRKAQAARFGLTLVTPQDDDQVC